MTYPKCRYCHRPRLTHFDTDHTLTDAEQGVVWATDLCGVCIDVEFCCNVAKDVWGTKSLARFIAIDYGMDEALAELDREEVAA